MRPIIARFKKLYTYARPHTGGSRDHVAAQKSVGALKAAAAARARLDTLPSSLGYPGQHTTAFPNGDGLLRTGRDIIMLTLVTLAIGGCCLVAGGLAIDCFHCVSVGGDNRDCDDPFHNNGSLGFLQSPCLGGRKGRDGLFPATACVKIAGVYHDSGVSLTVRSCALDSGTLTTDSELIRMSHCGGFYYENRYLKGCVQSCSDADACNHSERRFATGYHYQRYLLVLGSLLSWTHRLL